MKRFIYAVGILVLIACAKKETNSAPPANAPATTAQPTTSSAAEATYPITATIVSRDPAKNMVNLDNKEVPGKMGAMNSTFHRSGLSGDAAGEIPLDYHDAVT